MKHVWMDAARADVRNVTFLMTDAEIKSEDFLEQVNSFLNTGEIGGMLEKADKDTASGEVDKLPEAKQLGELKPAEKWAMTISRVRDNLHLVMAFSPVGEKFRDRFVKFPSVFNMSAIDWFLQLPQEALIETAHQLLDNFKVESDSPDGKSDLEKFMGAAHTMVGETCLEQYIRMRRQVQVTPKS